MYGFQAARNRGEYTEHLDPGVKEGECKAKATFARSCEPESVTRKLRLLDDRGQQFETETHPLIVCRDFN